LLESVLNEVSFKIDSGEVIGIVGPVGAGKTTLCRAIAGLVPSITGGDTSGEMNVSDRDRQQGQVGMVFEDYAAQLIQLKVLEEVKTPLLNRGLSPEEAEEQAKALLDKVGLGMSGIEKKRIWDLSGGQQQRLAIAATLAMEPQVIIIDNVMDKLDPEGREQVRGIVTELNGHKTQVIVDRDPHLLLEKTQRLLIFVDGRIIAQGTPEELLRNESLLDRADIEPPICLRLARTLGLSDSPLTLEEFERAYRPINNQNSPSLTAKTPRTKTNFGNCIVCLENVTFSYSKDAPNAIADFNLSLSAGEVSAIVGRSGAGKTTIIKHIAGLVKPNRGKVIVGDADVGEKSVSELGMLIGTVLQNPDDQISERTVKDEIAFPLKQRQYQRNNWFSKQKRYDDNYIEERVKQACQLTGIEDDWLDRDPFLLPRGQQKLVTIAAALVVEPKVLLLDEPVIGLGATARRKIQQAIARLRESGKAVLLVSNNIDFVAEVADTVTVLE
jgi:energy-coupling factor transport system ATP-binding protein